MLDLKNFVALSPKPTEPFWSGSSAAGAVEQRGAKMTGRNSEAKKNLEISYFEGRVYT